MADSRYDTEEALSLMAVAAEEFDPDEAAAEKAAEALIAQLRSLHGRTRVQLAPVGGSSEVTEMRLAGTAVWIRHDGRGTFSIAEVNGIRVARIADLRFNPVKGILEGTKALAGGDGLPEQRSALAVVMDAALARLRELKAPR